MLTVRYVRIANKSQMIGDRKFTQSLRSLGNGKSQ